MSPSALPDPLSWTELLRVFGGLVVVIVVLVAALWLLKRFQTGLRTPSGPMRVLACLHVLSTPVELQPPAGGQGLGAALPPTFPDWLRRAVEQRGKAKP
ncbi:Flagellar biosynthesis protein, FliO [Thiomonas arsenitoxydans]|uniref:Flagellar biosynthesis protein, FliO n=1 Tax=Thiomonas arsenitoxydans (strain DSM 22701 / CIP 110005 / 3As) TaxID=426114 RepID=A0ABM9T5X8_THIA3|nr:hypothetical protein [Thiomonas arsenitoxydans]CQR32547.1 Flagellar biosynthesis protein, FliO [Thiomonas arsenitoxydans]CQR32898.1 Flagellar biosynthesis protein, FliO [Thiomonas arsenitoxydans]CQR34104.1 Flagellar biosynthesis protein, FliO [Thiomonas arsenitoxydans]CQR40394.1 Flagellar biosynthesis protein, FliO [Thiomonas arsenitoxydans]